MSSLKENKSQETEKTLTDFVYGLSFVLNTRCRVTSPS